MESQKTMIAMSGGVDSSVAAYLTLQAGYTCIGAIAQMCDAALLGDAYSTQSILDARSVADRLGIELQVLDAAAPFKQAVVEPFIACYEQGLTPNPCIECNKHIKFSYLLDKALELGCRSGRIRTPGGIYCTKPLTRARISPIFSRD